MIRFRELPFFLIKVFSCYEKEIWRWEFSLQVLVFYTLNCRFHAGITEIVREGLWSPECNAGYELSAPSSLIYNFSVFEIQCSSHVDAVQTPLLCIL